MCQIHNLRLKILWIQNTTEPTPQAPGFDANFREMGEVWRSRTAGSGNIGKMIVLRRRPVKSRMVPKTKSPENKGNDTMHEREKLAALAANLGIELDEDGLDYYTRSVTGFMGALDAAENIPLSFAPNSYARDGWSPPDREDNPLNAWYVMANVEGSPTGPLKGKTIALKDNVMLEGAPVMNGTQILEGYMAKEDATVVTRLLDAGAHIVGKSTCEAYCMSCSSFLSDPAPVLNPHDPSRSAGGSSSGSAALVASGAVDMAIGCDQGGSIRMPASFCGIVGMKPTHGLVPYTGILGHDPVIDHVGPMTRTVADNALMLETLAGADGIDSRQYSPRVTPYVETLEGGVTGLRIGVMKQGFEHPASEADVNESVRAAVARLQALGAEVTEVSVPEHAMTGVLLAGMLIPTTDMAFMSEGFMPGREDVIDPDFARHQATWRDKTDALPDSAVAQILMSEYAKQERGYAPVARSTRLISQLRAAYDRALRDVDILVMPTTPMKASLLPEPGASLDERLHLAFSPSANTRPFNFTHHPALSVPCGMSEGLPVGMMLVGRFFEEAVLYRAASAFETL